MRLGGHLDAEVIAERLERLSELADELCNQRADERLGEVVQVLIETVDGDGRWLDGPPTKGPEVDGATSLVGSTGLAIWWTRSVVDATGVDLIAASGWTRR